MTPDSPSTEENKSNFDLSMIKQEVNTQPLYQKDSNGELTYNETLSDIDESEVEQFLLTPEESELKNMLWELIHKDWIEEQNIKKGKQKDFKLGSEHFL